MSNPFKVGDRVRCIEGCETEMIEGSIHTVVSANEDFVGFRDDIADWCCERYELVEAAPNPKETGCFIVVARDSTGTSSGGGVLGQFKTLEKAIEEAEYQTLSGPQMPYVVFKAVKAFTRSTEEIPV